MIQTTAYDTLGRVASTSVPAYFSLLSSTPTSAYNFSYDNLDRLIMMTNPDGTSRTQSYTGLTTKYIDENSNESDVFLDALGRVQRSEEALAKGRVIATSFEYGPFDTIKRVVDPTGRALIADYDQLGRRVRLQTADEGTVFDSFNAFNEVIEETNGNGAKTNFNMDAAGRLVGTTSPDGTATYTWDTASHGIGKPASVTSADGIVSTFAYDDLSRLQSTTYQVGGSSYTYGYTYDLSAARAP